MGELTGTNWSRTYGYLLAAAVTLTISLTVTRHVIAPRTAYRLGWNARDRHDCQAAPVVRLDEPRRA